MEGLPVACCTWQPATWSVMYIGLAFFVMTWMLMILLQIRLFTVRYVSFGQTTVYEYHWGLSFL